MPRSTRGWRVEGFRKMSARKYESVGILRRLLDGHVARHRRSLRLRQVHVPARCRRRRVRPHLRAPRALLAARQSRAEPRPQNGATLLHAVRGRIVRGAAAAVERQRAHGGLRAGGHVPVDVPHRSRLRSGRGSVSLRAAIRSVYVLHSLQTKLRFMAHDDAVHNGNDLE